MPKHHTVRVCQITEYLGKREAFEWAAKVTTFEAWLHEIKQKNGDRLRYEYAVVRVLEDGENVPGTVFEVPESELVPVRNLSGPVRNK